MSFPELFAIAVALAMDAFAVSVCAGCALKRVTVVHFLRLSLTFGFFQFLMPVIGWALGLTVRGFIESWGSLDRLRAAGMDRRQHDPGRRRRFRRRGKLFG